jgi:hypothetical protein
MTLSIEIGKLRKLPRGGLSLFVLPFVLPEPARRVSPPGGCGTRSA